MNILIFRDDGIGDLIVSSSLIERLLLINESTKITLITSNRNFKYAEILLNNKKISKIINIDDYKSPISGFFAIYNKLKITYYDHVFILNSSNRAMILAKMIKTKYISGIVPLNSESNGRNRYKPIKKLINFFYSYYEIIDCRQNYKLSKNIHMNDHYAALFEKSINVSSIKIPNPNYIIPKLSDDEQINKIKTSLSCMHIKKFLIFHFDEKWNLTNFSKKQILRLITEISNEYKDNIIITRGLYDNKYQTNLESFLNFEKNITHKLNTILNKSKKIKNIYLIKNLNLKSLFFLTSISDFIIEPHGALTHIASIYNKPIIDLVPKNKANFFSKWKPRSHKMKQVCIEDTNEILKTLKALS